MGSGGWCEVLGGGGLVVRNKPVRRPFIHGRNYKHWRAAVVFATDVVVPSPQPSIKKEVNEQKGIYNIK